jgi:hypothetical protein
LAAHRDAARPLPEREKVAETLAQQALDLLRRATQAGYFKQAGKTQAMKTNADLAFLRPRDDFKRWLADVEGAAGPK